MLLPFTTVSKRIISDHYKYVGLRWENYIKISYKLEVRS